MSRLPCLTCGEMLPAIEVIGPLPDDSKSTLGPGALVVLIVVECEQCGTSVHDVEPFAPQTSDDVES